MRLASLEHFKKRIHTFIFIIGWLANLIAWALSEVQNSYILPQRPLFAVGFVLLPLLVVLAWKPGFPQRVVDGLTVLYVAGISAACLWLGFYSAYRELIRLETLYMWTPVMYMFTFSLGTRKQAAVYSAVLWLVFFMISLPFLLTYPNSPEAFYNIQLHLMSVFFIVAFFYFSTYRKHLHVAQLNVDELAVLANTDSLTQLANRRRIEEVMKGEHLRFARYQHPYALILIDIDYFKKFNDEFGHDVGDTILQALANRIQEVLREVDTLARWGGEELLVLLPETGFSEALIKAEHICDHVRERTLLGEHSITLSCGVTEVGDGDTPASIFKRVDEALYEAKDKGRNRVEGLRAEQISARVA